MVDFNELVTEQLEISELIPFNCVNIPYLSTHTIDSRITSQFTPRIHVNQATHRGASAM
jgi:hypothetical protein